MMAKKPSVKIIDGGAEITQNWKQDPVTYKPRMQSNPGRRAVPPNSKIGPNVQKGR